jgi:hypothetical protein
MKAFMAGLAMLITVGQAARAEEPNDSIEGVIQDQIDAFLADDVATAFTFASPSIQSIFQTPENFGMMVRNGYPMVWRPTDVDFAELRDVAGGLWQRVIVTDQAGRVHALDYNMVEVDGIWQINAVQLLEMPEVGA